MEYVHVVLYMMVYDNPRLHKRGTYYSTQCKLFTWRSSWHGKGAINSGDFDSLKYLVIKYVVFSVENTLNILKYCTIPRKLLLMVNPLDGFFRGRSKEKRILKMCVFASFPYKKSSDVFQKCCNK